MSTSPPLTDFVDRRDPNRTESRPGVERRQFSDSHESLSPDARELAIAIESYKIQNRRRFITYEEMLGIFLGLGYSRSTIEA